MIPALFTLTALGLSLGLMLGFAAIRFRVETNPLIAEIESKLPGSQCGQCGFPGCSPAAEAVVNGNAPVTMCPPGGKALAQQLADLLGISIDLSSVKESKQLLARVREETCIGCTRCYKVCPTDAIVGAPKQIHTVVQDACTGCGNCVDVCPTECLQLGEPLETIRTWHWPMPAPSRQAA